MREIRIVMTGGGTGGHLFPLIATAAELRELAAKLNLLLGIYYVGPMRGPFVIDEAIFREKGIISREIRAGNGIAGIPALLLGIFQSLWQMYLIMPDVVFSKGGYGSLPVILAAIFYRIPILIHESDAVPGKVNEFASRFSQRVAVSFEKSLPFFPKEKTALVGNPVRKSLLPLPDRDRALEFLGMDRARKTILVLGGSQGSAAINELVLDLLPELLKEYQVIHQCGPKNFAAVEAEAKVVLKNFGAAYEPYYKLYGFLLEENLKDAYAVSDIVVSRAGSGQIFELAIAAKPAILLPFRYASRGHQRENAYEYSRGGAALVLEEENLTPHLFLSELSRLLADEHRLRGMAAAAAKFAKPDAARLIAQELLRLARVNL